MPKVVNEVTAEGFELGYHLARFVDAEEKKEPLPHGRERCHNCAFRQGTYPNGSPTTTMDALKCAMEGTTFLCHEDLQPCAGWALLRRADPQKKYKIDWPFSDEISPESGGSK
jgi:hypothetical protein